MLLRVPREIMVSRERCSFREWFRPLNLSVVASAKRAHSNGREGESATNLDIPQLASASWRRSSRTHGVFRRVKEIVVP